MSPFTGRKKWKAWNKTREKYMPVKRRHNLAETGWGAYYKEEWLEPQPIQTSLRRLKKVTMSHDQTRCRHDVWKDVGLMTSDLRRLIDVQFTTSWRCLIYDVFRKSGLRRPEDVWFTSSWRRPIWDVLNPSDLRRLQDVKLGRLEDVQFRMSWRRLIYDVCKTTSV